MELESPGQELTESKSGTSSQNRDPHFTEATGRHINFAFRVSFANHGKWLLAGSSNGATFGTLDQARKSARMVGERRRLAVRAALTTDAARLYLWPARTTAAVGTATGNQILPLGKRR